MFYLEFLRALHQRLSPRTYLEIGVAQGHSLALSRCPSIGIDPAFQVDQQILGPVSLLRCTSDDYFDRLTHDGLTPFGPLPIDLGYIDGMHHFEYALRDFIAVERYCDPSSVIAFDDVLPRTVEEAARERDEMPWTGDVFRVRSALETHRPDLCLITVDTEPAGTLLVARLDPSSRILEERLDDIVRDYVMPDPQPVPREILERTSVTPPEEALTLPVWDALRLARTATEAGARGRARAAPRRAPRTRST